MQFDIYQYILYLLISPKSQLTWIRNESCPSEVYDGLISFFVWIGIFISFTDFFKVDIAYPVFSWKAMYDFAIKFWDYGMILWIICNE